MTTPEAQRAALELVLPLLRTGLREIVEAASERAPDRYHFIRGPMPPDDEAWVAPWRAGVAAVEAALGLPLSNDDGGVAFLDEKETS